MLRWRCHLLGSAGDEIGTCWSPAERFDTDGHRCREKTQRCLNVRPRFGLRRRYKDDRLRSRGPRHQSRAPGCQRRGNVCHRRTWRAGHAPAVRYLGSSRARSPLELRELLCRDGPVHPAMHPTRQRSVACAECATRTLPRALATPTGSPDARETSLRVLRHWRCERIPLPRHLVIGKGPSVTSWHHSTRLKNNAFRYKSGPNRAKTTD